MISPSFADLLADSKAPRLVAVSPAHAQTIMNAGAAKGFAVWKLDGRKMKDDDSIFDHFAEVMKFPDYFGRNWDALEECLRDMEWSPAKAHLVVLNDADALYLNAPESYASLIQSLRFCGEQWHECMDQRIPFKVLLVTKSPEIAASADASQLA